MVGGSLQSLYTVCLQRFNSIQLGQAWAGDDEFLVTEVNDEKARFISWGQVLGLHDSDRCESMFENPDLGSAIVQVMKCVTRCLEEIKMSLSKHSPLQGDPKNGFILAQRFKRGGTFRKNLGRFLNRLMCFNFRRRRSAGVHYMTVDQETMAALVDELRELIDSLVSITRSPGQLERQPTINVCWDTKLNSEWKCVELDQPNSPSNYRTMPTSKEVFATIVKKDSLARKAFLHKLKNDGGYSGGCSKRIITELSRVADYDELQENISLAPLDGDMFNCLGTIYGPQGTPYDGGIFYLSIKFPPDYPFKPPKIRFLTKVFHPNIDADGHICLDILHERWCPALTISRVLLSISSFLDDPNPNQSLRSKVSKQYKNNKAAYENNVRMFVKRYATGKLPSMVELREGPEGSLTPSTTTTKRNYTYSEDPKPQEKRWLAIPFEEQPSDQWRNLPVDAFSKIPNQLD
ncbi:hypothetical protein MMC27_007331 [Xylographa pallens]|nr:hypothetical protein [Xylographa pallens]